MNKFNSRRIHPQFEQTFFFYTKTQKKNEDKITDDEKNDEKNAANFYRRVIIQ